MTASDFRHITDELLSAYIDDEITDQERNLIDAAIAAEPEIAWRVDSLRQTVALLQELPELPLPRAFTLQVAQLGDVVHGHAAALGKASDLPPKPRTQVTQTPSLWEQWRAGWRDFWQAGNPILRNAAAASFALMLLVSGGSAILTRALTQPAGMPVAEMSAPSDAASLAAPAAEVALAPQEEATPSATEAAGADTAAAAEGESMTRMAAPPTALSATDEPGAEAPVMAAAAEPPAESSAASVPAAMAAGESSEGESAPEAAMAAALPESPAAAAAAAPADQALAPPAPVPMPGGMGGGGDGPGVGNGPVGGGAEGAVLTPGDAFAFDAEPIPEAAAASIAAEPEAVPAETAVKRSSESAADSVEGPAEESADESSGELTAAPAEEAAAAMTARTADASAETASSDPGTASGDEAQDAGAQTENAAPTAIVASVALLAPEPTASPITATPASVGTSLTTTEAGSASAQAPVTSALPEETGMQLIRLAQAGTFLLTLMLGALWWRSRGAQRKQS